VTRGGARGEGGPGSHRQGQLGRRGTASSRPAATRASGTHVTDERGPDGSRKGTGERGAGRVWVGRGRKRSGPSPYEK
jgi:hypothetical protein